MLLLVFVALSSIFGMQMVSTLVLTGNQEFDTNFKGYPDESLPSTNSIKMICHLPQRDDYIYTPEIGAHKLHIDARPWNESRRICEMEKARLVVINSKAEELFLMETLKKSQALVQGATLKSLAFLGVHSLFGPDQWVTISGNSFYAAGYEHWSDGQPSIQSYSCMAIDTDGGTRRIDCQASVAFFCELSLECRPLEK